MFAVRRFIAAAAVAPVRVSGVFPARFMSAAGMQAHQHHYLTPRVASRTLLEDACRVSLIFRQCCCNLAFFFSAAPDYKYILVDKRGAKSSVGVITLNRPKGSTRTHTLSLFASPLSPFLIFS